MFTGIVRQVGAVRRVRGVAGGSQLTVEAGPLAAGLAPGDSVAVAGACLTVTAIRDTEVDFDVTAETLSKTTLGSVRAGAKVNLERSLRLSDALDGHLVQGHVDGLAEVRAIHTTGRHVAEFAAAAELTAQMVPKGSVCLDGVSLTLVDVRDGRFSVALIPTTLAQTTLGDLAIGSKVNIETDVIGKYVLKHLHQLGGRAGSGGLTLEKLKEAGFA